MKKYFIIAAAAVVAMAACSKTEIEQNSANNKKIGFEVANYALQTKAQGEEKALTNAEDGIYQFHTYACQFPELGDPVNFMDVDIFPWNVTTENNSVTRTQVTKDNDENYTITEWAPEYDYFWPKTGYVNFYSYAGTHSPDNNKPATANGMKDLTLTYTGAEIASTSNILVSNAALHFNYEAYNKATYQKDDSENSGHMTTGVPTLFRHQLAKVKVDVKIQTDPSKVSPNTIWKVQVLDNYSINSVDEHSYIIPIKKGTLVLTNNDGLEATATKNITTQAWTPQSGTGIVDGWAPATPAAATTENIQLHQETVLTMPENAYESKKTENNAVVTAVEELLAFRSVMPQETDNVGFKLIYKVQALHGDTVFMEEIRTVGIGAHADIHDLTGSIAEWNANKKITYHIIIDPVSNKVTFDPAVEDYDTVEANANDVININEGGIVPTPSNP